MTHAETPPDMEYPKLPFWRTIGLAYSSYFHHFIDVLRASWLWLVVVETFEVLASWQHWPRIGKVMANLMEGEPSKVPISTAFLILSVAWYLLLSLAGVSIAVAWHRLVILNERPGCSGCNIATKDLWRYVAAAIALFLIPFLPEMAIGFSSFHVHHPASGPPPSLGLIVLMLAVYVLATLVALRLTLLLPARAIGDTSLTLKRTWSRTSGNTWRLFWGSWVTAGLPILIVQIVFSFLNEHLVATLGGLFFLPVWVGFLSHSYQYFFRDDPLTLLTYTPVFR